MTFILVTGSIMAVSIFLIYHLCRFIGIEMKWLSLVLCAAMAFLVNAVAITMSPFLDRSHYLRLGVLVIAAAAFVTLFNEHLLRRSDDAGKQPADEPAAALPWKAEQPAMAAAAAGAATSSPALPSVPAKVHEEKPEPSTTVTAKQEDTAQQAAALKAKKAQEAAARAEEELAAKAEQAAKAKAEAIARAQALQAEKDEARRKAAEELKAQKAAASARDAKRKVFREEITALDSLDSILDYAYDKAASEPDAAIYAYQQAIDRYKEDSYTPFLVIELGNLYKEQAAYTEAIQSYQQALSLPIIASNDDMKQEFIKNTRYLTIVQDILSKHHALSTPFPDIPADVMQEIETEFQQSS
ncbi:colicin import membrane protein [Selenomonas sp. GACV-9]|uniref:hypothetical protein n=1 Tax=Selenomonas sp. GACV-9 TaxID=3158782 RepID=UPI0008F32908|nr:colicin import membrane protein [Selenomonas ruminantium]